MRAAAVAALVDLLGHPAPEVRWRAASSLRHVGRAAAPHADALVAACADRRVAALLLRPLRLLGRPEARALLADVLAGDDDRALLYHVEHVGEGDPPEWIPLLERRLERLRGGWLGGDAFGDVYRPRLGRAGDAPRWRADEVARRVEAALDRLRGAAKGVEGVALADVAAGVDAGALEARLAEEAPERFVTVEQDEEWLAAVRAALGR